MEDRFQDLKKQEHKEEVVKDQEYENGPEDQGKDDQYQADTEEGLEQEAYSEERLWYNAEAVHQSRTAHECVKVKTRVGTLQAAMTQTPPEWADNPLEPSTGETEKASFAAVLVLCSA
ncbi:hypothetical protein NDU88_003383 [Pleurodeles waltl]|uniref:Uncharacterized protein n=1 Tax=Pleurodeles waltl TaxID=8319 RepID=A0AAV7UYA1_PLEWA|nr:hypothetical protein NDU88_003383 [Pleurodeles waltl]